MSALNLLRAVVLIGLLLPFAHLSARAATLPGQGRVTSTAIICAFEPERAALVKRIKGAATRHLDGMEFVTGRLGSQPVVLMTSGVSMVNAAMNTQLAIDHFRISRIVFSGIAGGLDPALGIGDVAVPERWSEALEVVMARDTPEGFRVPPWMDGLEQLPSYGMMTPRAVHVGSRHRPPEFLHDFSVDVELLALARRSVADLPLRRCASAEHCLDRQPHVSIGGAGVSGPAFIDNAGYRDYLAHTWHASVVDMESAAVAQVAYHNEVPFLIFRSVSDLAGGDGQPNQMAVFMDLAAENSAAVVEAFVRALPRP